MSVPASSPGPGPAVRVQVSDSALLRKSSCNYLRSVSASGRVALAAVGGLRVFAFSRSSGRVLDTFCTLRLPAGDLVRDVAWRPHPAPHDAATAPEGLSDTLAVCFEDRLELWTSRNEGKTFEKYSSYSFEQKIVGILHLIWTSSCPREIYICTSTLIHCVSLSDTRASSEEISGHRMPGLNMRHPGGLACSPAGSFVTGNSHREVIMAVGLQHSDTLDAKISGVVGRRRQVVQRCRAPCSLSPQQIMFYDRIKYNPCCTVSSKSICVLGFEPEARIAPAPGIFTPSAVDSDGPLGGGVSMSVSKNITSSGNSLISVVSSSPLIANVDEVGTSMSGLSDNVILASANASLSTNSHKPKGAFPHSTFNTSITETLSISRTNNFDEIRPDVASMCSPLEALKSLSINNNYDAETSDASLLNSSSSSNIDDANGVQLMKAGLFCAVRTTGESLEWLGSEFSYLDDVSSTVSLVRPDIIALHELRDGCSLLLAISSTLASQILVYIIRNTEGEGKATINHIHSFHFDAEERCRGLTLLPVTTNASREQAEFNETVVLLALAAKPKAQSVASQSTSALYETSLLNFRIPIENRKWTVPERIIDAEATISPSSHSDAKLNSTKNANDTIIQLLHDMNKTFEDRLDSLEAAMSSQGKKIDHLQACVDKLVS